MSDYYRRDGSGPVEYSPELMKDKRVAHDTLDNENSVSTVFLGLNHQYGDGPPLIFETMVFGGKYDQEQERYATEAQALEGHARWVALASEDIPEDVAAMRDLIDASESYGNSIRLAEHLLASGVKLPD
jgi:hypothetical protein